MYLYRSMRLFEVMAGRSLTPVDGIMDVISCRAIFFCFVRLDRRDATGLFAGQTLHFSFFFPGGISFLGWE